jgi:2-polyprenyl-3-methyl-5-hydroxy-6-metoxy-1,4-benzoquinol methylase
VSKREGPDTIIHDGSSDPPGQRSSDRLTATAYWDQIWRGKTGVRADLTEVQRSYVAAVTDHIYRIRLPEGSHWRFLEVGCGTGRELVYFHRMFGYTVTGCDYSQASGATARRTLEIAGVPGTILNGDLFALSGEYDIIASGGLIEHFTEPKTVLAKFTSLLNPSRGILISAVPNLSGLSGLYHRVLKPETFTTHRVVTLEQLREWYTDLGLRNIEVGALGSLIPHRFPRDVLRRRYPGLYGVFWRLFLGPDLGAEPPLSLGLSAIRPAGGEPVVLALPVCDRGAVSPWTLAHQ